MATQRYRIVSGDESDLHEEPHIEGSRVSVRGIHARVEERGSPAPEVAEQLRLDVAEVYEALAYYHRNPAEMRTVERRHEQAAAEARERSSIVPPADRN